MAHFCWCSFFHMASSHMLLYWRQLRAMEKDKGHRHGALMRAAPIPAAADGLPGVRILVRTIKSRQKWSRNEMKLPIKARVALNNELRPMCGSCSVRVKTR